MVAMDSRQAKRFAPPTSQARNNRTKYELKDWGRSNSDFNGEVWCVACDGGSYGQ